MLKPFWTQSPVMGILNVTPDSFSDGGCYTSVECAVQRGCQMAEQGACCIDIGGESTRPGFTPVPVEEECRRVVPVVSALYKELGSRVVLSVDTRKPEVARRALAEGASVINDVRGMQDVEVMSALMREYHAWYVLMHSGKEAVSATEILAWFQAKIREAERCCPGVDTDGFILDPGVGFHRGAEDDVAWLRMIPDLKMSGAPLLIGASRKSFLKYLTGREVEQRLSGSVAVAALSRYLGADILRVHDVSETVDACRVAEAFGRQG